MQPSEIVERERRWAVPVAVATLVGVAFFVGSIVIQLGVVGRGKGDAGALLKAHDHEFAVIASSILQSVGFALFAAPLAYLFQAARARSEKVRPGMAGLTIAGPVLFAVGTGLTFAGVLHIAPTFADHHLGTGHAGQRVAKKLLEDESLLQIGGTIVLAGRLALAAGLLYTALWSMRVGLLTTFWGTLGMAIGVATVLGFLPGVVLWLVPIAFLIAGWSSGPRPPAWETGEAIPWENTRFAVPDDDAGSADPPALPPDTGPSGAPDEPAGAAPTRRKRKRRG